MKERQRRREGGLTAAFGRRFAWVAVGIALAVPVARASEAPPEQGVVADYEARLEGIAAGILEIRAELEDLVAELARGELSRVFVFLEAQPPNGFAGGVRVLVDGKSVFSRPLVPAELDVLARGLPLELVTLWLPSGPHEVVLGALGAALPDATPLSLEPGKNVSWVAGVGASGVEWRAE